MKEFLTELAKLHKSEISSKHSLNFFVHYVVEDDIPTDFYKKSDKDEYTTIAGKPFTGILFIGK